MIVRCNSCMTYDTITDEEFKEHLEKSSTSCRECSRAMRSKHRVGIHQPYGMLRPLARVIDRAGNVGFVCKCDCGTYVVRRDSVVYCGYSKSCGCKTGNFYNFEWIGDESYTLTDDDLKAMDKLVCMLGSDLKVDSKVSICSDASENTVPENTNAITLESLRERFMKPTDGFKEDDSVVEGEKTLEEDILTEVEEVVEEDVLCVPEVYEDVAVEKEPVISESLSLEDEFPWDKPAEEHSSVEIKEESTDTCVSVSANIFGAYEDPFIKMKGQSITVFSMQCNLKTVSEVAKPILEERGFDLLSCDSRVISDLIEFLDSCSKNYIDELVRHIYDANSDVFVLRDHGKVVLVLVLSESEVKVYTWACANAVAAGVVGVLGGLYVHSN